MSPTWSIPRPPAMCLAAASGSRPRGLTISSVLEAQEPDSLQYGSTSDGAIGMRTRIVFTVVSVLCSLSNLASAQGQTGTLTEDQLTGKKLFLQRCSICHLPQEPAPRASLGPRLEGIFLSGDQMAVE